jgi:hypothetical protein
MNNPSDPIAISYTPPYSQDRAMLLDPKLQRFTPNVAHRNNVIKEHLNTS